MEAISTALSPTRSTTPPHSPYNLVQYHHALPPLKSLPTWNRTKFSMNTTVRSIPNNKQLKLQVVENDCYKDSYMQTSPPSSAGSASAMPLQQKAANTKEETLNKIRHVYDKKLLFLQSNHKDVLSSLHREIQVLKNENKALQFQLVMVGGKTILFSYPIAGTEGPKDSSLKDIKYEQMEFVKLQKEVAELRKSLHAEKLKNNNLMLMLEDKKERSKSARLHSMINKAKMTLAKFDHQEQANKTPPSFDASVKDTKDKRDLNCFYNQQTAAVTSSTGPIKELKHLTDTQESELRKLKEELKYSSTLQKKELILPKLVPWKRSDNLMCKEKQLFASSQIKEDTTSLPALQTTPSIRNLSLRQKRAQALHIQRQRSNKDMSLLCEK